MDFLKNKKVKWGIIVLILAGCAFGGWKYYQSQQAAKQTAAVTTADVQRMDMKSTVSATGTIRPHDSVEVSSKITARIKTVLVKENDEVQAGQTIATLDGKDYEAKKDQAQFKVTNTKSKYDRVAYLNSIGAKSDQDLDDARYEYDTAQSALQEAESDLNETVITAPMSGVVVGMTMTALAPNCLAAYATPCAWLPADAVIRPRLLSSSLSVLIL